MSEAALDGNVSAADTAAGLALLAEYDRLWAEHGSGAKVRSALGLRHGEHFEIAARRLHGAVRVARARRAVCTTARP